MAVSLYTLIQTSAPFLLAGAAPCLLHHLRPGHNQFQIPLQPGLESRESPCFFFLLLKKVNNPSGRRTHPAADLSKAQVALGASWHQLLAEILS